LSTDVFLISGRHKTLVKTMKKELIHNYFQEFNKFVIEG